MLLFNQVCNLKGGNIRSPKTRNPPFNTPAWRLHILPKQIFTGGPRETIASNNRDVKIYN